jgi:small subunit ribosomal protein S14
MAKTSKLARNAQRRELVQRHAPKRAALKAIIQNPKSTQEERLTAVNALHAMPRDSSATRVRNRCNMSGRPRGFLRQFGLSRIALRDMALNGFIPGVRKASW